MNIILLVILLIWAMAGLSAFIMSLVCFGYSGSMTNKFLGLVIALMFGPFYWFYYFMNPSYCT